MLKLSLSFPMKCLGLDLKQNKTGFIEFDLTATGFAWNLNVFFEIVAKRTILAVI